MDSLDQISEEVSHNKNIAESTTASQADQDLTVFPDCYIGRTNSQDNPASY